MKRFFTTVATDKAAPVDWTNAREFETDTRRDAAILAFKCATGAPRSAFHRGETVIVYTWPEDSPKHPTGAPICVHAFEMVLGEKVKQL